MYLKASRVGYVNWNLYAFITLVNFLSTPIFVSQQSKENKTSSFDKYPLWGEYYTLQMLRQDKRFSDGNEIDVLNIL
jgi:hypothetical protein